MNLILHNISRHHNFATVIILLSNNYHKLSKVRTPQKKQPLKSKAFDSHTLCPSGISYTPNWGRYGYFWNFTMNKFANIKLNLGAHKRCVKTTQG